MTISKFQIKNDKKILIKLEDIFFTQEAKSHWKKYSEYLNPEKILFTKTKKKEKHEIYWMWIKSLSNEPIDVKLKIGEMYCLAFDHVLYIDTISQKSIYKIFDINIEEIKSIIHLYIFKDYEANPTKLRWIACFFYGSISSDVETILHPDALLQQALTINPNDLNCKEALLFNAIGRLSSVIYWGPDFEFHHHVNQNDFEPSLNDSIRWSCELHQRELWETIIDKAHLSEINNETKNYFEKNFPSKNVNFFDYLKLEQKTNLIENWPYWFRLYDSTYYSDDIIKNIRLNLENLYQSSFSL